MYAKPKGLQTVQNIQNKTSSPKILHFVLISVSETVVKLENCTMQKYMN